MKLIMGDYPGFHERMSRLREMEIGLDGAICAGDGEARVHLSYMAACNQSLFNRIIGLKKQGKSELYVKNVSLQGMQLIVDYCYTGEIEITEDNFESIIDAALALELLDIVEQCVQFALTPNVNANIWCHFLRAAFKHPRYVQSTSFVPDLILINIKVIPREAIIKGLNAAYIREILEHGKFDDRNGTYAMNIFLEIILEDKTDIQNYKETISCMKDKIGQNDKFVLPSELLMIRVISLVELSLIIGCAALVEACAEAMEQLPSTVEFTSKVLEWMKLYAGSESETHLNTICYHLFCKLPLDISEDDLCVMLDKDCICQSSEIDIFKAAFKWIEHNNANVETKRRVIGNIRFGLMTKEEMEEVFVSYYVSGCEVELASAMRYNLSLHNQPLEVGPLNKPRCADPLIYIIGGKDPGNNYNQNVFMSTASLKQNTLRLSPFKVECESPFALHDVGCALWNGFIFIAGGEGESGVVDTLFRFDTRTSAWLTLSDMKQKRKRHTLSSMSDASLIAVGGTDGEEAIACVEKFEIGTNKWMDLKELPECHEEHAASTVDAVLYISGGSSSKTLLSYADSIWNRGSPMLQVRQAHQMAGVSGMLFVAGGAVYAKRKWMDVRSAEVYDITQDQWTELSPPKIICQQAFSTRINNWWYVFGGYSDNTKTKLDIIQRYNIETNVWEVYPVKLPLKVNRMVGACISNE